MADYSSALVTRLMATPSVAALVGTKIYWVKAPQNTTLPYVRLQAVSDPRPSHLKGFERARVTRVQADCFAASYSASKAIAEAIIIAASTPVEISGVKFGRTNVDVVRDLGEDVNGTFVHRASVDLLVEHALA